MRVRPTRPAGPLTFRIIAALIVVAALSSVAATGLAWARKDITVIVDGKQASFSTVAGTVAGLLAEHRIHLRRGDIVTPSPADSLSAEVPVVVRHSMPVTLELGKDSEKLDVVGSTVADVLVAAGVDPDPALLVSPDLATPLRAGMTVRAIDSYLTTEVDSYRVAYSTLVHEDTDLAAGRRRVEKRGREGRGERVWNVAITSGRPGSRVLVSDTVIEPPVDEIVAVGTKRGAGVASLGALAPQPAPSPAPRPPAPPSEGVTLTVVATAYSANHGCGTRTFSGLNASFGIIAVDPRVIALGTRLYVPGYGYGLAADTGGAIKGKRIDLCYNDEAECERWGRQAVTVTVLP